MLRKDVKLGFAIGGIMLAVVIVYVLVVPSGDKKSVGIVTDESQNQSKADGATPDVKPADPETADKTNAPPAEPSKTEPDQSPTTAPAAAAGAPARNGPDWNKLLAEGSASPTMMSETPSLDTKHVTARSDPAPSPSEKNDAEKPAADQTVADATPVNPLMTAPAAAGSAEKINPDYSIDTASTPATQPAESSQRTHVVQPGEMLTSIAAAAYGDSRKWKHIAEANPNVNPNRLAPGTKLVIPALKSSSGSSIGTAAVATTIDPQTQYEVQPNDSLYRISMKLYGKPDHVDKLYDANKDVIGSDPKRLKLNMVLKLTDPPTSTLTNTASR